MSLKAKGIKLVTLDATNTILNFRIPPWQYYAVVAKNYGFSGSDDAIKHRLKENYKLMWDKYPNFGKSKITWEVWWTQVIKKTFNGQLPAESNVDIIANKLIEGFKTSECWCVAPAGHKLLNILRSQIEQIGVISNFDPRLNEILQSVKVSDYFDFILTSYDVGYSKPDKEIFSHALKQCKIPVQPNEALHIGDDFHKDYEGARASGWHAILVTNTDKSEKPLAKKNVFKNLEDLSLAVDLNKLKL